MNDAMARPKVEPTAQGGFDEVRHLREKVLAEVRKVVVGQDDALEALLVAVLSQGHVLLEGVPGTAKTLMVRAVAASMGLEFGRIQFTPDLMPSDIVGTHVYDMSRGEFRMAKGPIFTELLLADEINRAPAKTQSALLQAMQERVVSIDGTDHTLSPHFTVFATQNPVEHEGTYPLPEAQLDRFLLKVRVGYPTPEEEDRILARSGALGGFTIGEHGIRPVVGREDVDRARAAALDVRVEDAVRRYVRDLVRATRDAPALSLGAGPRAGVHLLVASRFSAALEGRTFVTPDDVARMVPWVVCHRLVLSPEAELDGITAEMAMEQVRAAVPVPR
jgi:MoxR-like ATPase